MGGRHRSNRLGIAEPQGSQDRSAHAGSISYSCRSWASTARGVRLGAGGGYYDRAFAFRRWRTLWHAPRLVGLAYSFQQVEAITPAAHDVLLDAVVTEKGVIRCATG